MNTNPLRKMYWSALNTWRRRTRPSDTVVSPHNWLDGIARCLPDADDRVVYVDGGAHDGQTLCEVADRFPNLEAYAFEPNTDLCLGLEEALADKPGRCYPTALGAEPGEARIFINALPMTSSLLPRAEPSLRYFDAATTPREQRTVPVTTLDRWFAETGLDRVDILKLDLQGYELEALRGAMGLLRYGIGCVYTEVSFVPLYIGGPVFGEIDRFMRDHGYRLFNLYNLSTKNIDGQLNGADALYVPSRTMGAVPIRRAA